MPLKLLDQKLAVLGAGKLGGILLRALFEARPIQTEERNRYSQARRKGYGTGERAGRFCDSDNRRAVKDADIMLWCEAASGGRGIERNCAGDWRERGGDFGGGFGADKLSRTTFRRTGQW
jgi:hypothetical protein